MNRGSTACGLDLVKLKKASMRPRFMNRGSADRPIPRGAGAGRFNEAPIHESGK